jgi:peptidoglycan/xylan/chitin deacetylase (PgdA/CDA1 family)
MYSKIKHFYKEVDAYQKLKIGIKNWGHWSPLILLYHGVDLKSSTKYNYRFISDENFKKQLVFFKKHFNIIQVEDVFNGNYNKKVPNIALSFDDGYENWYTIAYPILKKLNIPASFYITTNEESPYPFLWTDFIDIASKLTKAPVEIAGNQFNSNKWGIYTNNTGKTLKAFLKEKEFKFKAIAINAFQKIIDINAFNHSSLYWKLLSEVQINKLANDPLFSIGSHGKLHNNLGNISIENAQKELVDSKRKLESISQKEIKEIAFPDGCYNREVLGLAEKIGYKYQLACNYLFEEDVNDIRVYDRKGIYSHIGHYQQLNSLFN